MYSTKLSVSVHILCLVSTEQPLASDKLAASIGTNPALVRRLMSRLKDAGILRTSPKLGAVGLGKEPDEISLYDIFCAVESNKTLFDIHIGSNHDCPVGACIEETLEGVYGRIYQNLETELKKIKLSELLSCFPKGK